MNKGNYSSSSSSPILSGDSSPFSVFTYDDEFETDCEMADLDLDADDEEKLQEMYGRNRTKYRDRPSSPVFETPSKQVRFVEQNSPATPSFCDPFSANANSTRHPPRYSKKIGCPSTPNVRSPAKELKDVKMRPLPKPMDIAMHTEADMNPPPVLTPSSAKLPDPEQGIWDTKISTAIDLAEGLIDLSNKFLTYIPTSIAHLAHLVTLPSQTSPPSSASSAFDLNPGAQKRLFRRNITAPAILSETLIPIQKVDTSKFDRGKSMKNAFQKSSSKAVQAKNELQIFLQNNRIEVIPPELCGLKNLVVLSLRSNALTEIPSSISSLTNLRELNVANNLLAYLPSEITNLPLTSLSVHPNPFYLLPHEVEPAVKCFGVLVIHNGGVPSLRELAIRRLIKPLSPNDTRSTLEELYTLPLPSSESSDISPELSRILTLTPTLMDSKNPLHSVCPSPRHQRKYEPIPLFVEPILERFEWIDRIGEVVISAPRVPIRWRGCSVECLSFLEGELKDISRECLPIDVEMDTVEEEKIAGLGPNDESFELSSDEDD